MPHSPDELGALRCVGVLPGLGHYDTDTSSDTDDSSDFDEVSIREPPHLSTDNRLKPVGKSDVHAIRAQNGRSETHDVVFALITWT